MISLDDLEKNTKNSGNGNNFFDTANSAGISQTNQISSDSNGKVIENSNVVKNSNNSTLDSNTQKDKTGWSLISKINKSEKEKNKVNFNIENLKLAKLSKQGKETKKINLGKFKEKKKIQKTKKVDLTKYIFVNFIVLIILLLVFVFQLRFLAVLKNIDEGKSLGRYQKIVEIFPFLKIKYADKKISNQNKINQISSQIFMLHGQLLNWKNIVIRNGFLPVEVEKVLKNYNKIHNLKKILIYLETLKFTSAINVFENIDSFVSELSNKTGLPREEVLKKLKLLSSKKGENLIFTYVNLCYLNPFEDTKCSFIGDFKKFIPDEIGYNFFVQLIQLVENNLENTGFPKFSITFNSINPKTNTITLTLQVNTTTEDEESLLKNGIANPHLYVVKQLVNFLRQSNLVLGKDIDPQKIKTTQNYVSINGKVEKITHSIMQFSLPLQDDIQKEIFDY